MGYLSVATISMVSDNYILRHITGKYFLGLNNLAESGKIDAFLWGNDYLPFPIASSVHALRCELSLDKQIQPSYTCVDRK